MFSLALAFLLRRKTDGPIEQFNKCSDFGPSDFLSNVICVPIGQLNVCIQLGPINHLMKEIDGPIRQLNVCV